MLEVTSSAEENRLGVDFAELYRRSNLYQYVLLLQNPSCWFCIFFSIQKIFCFLIYLFFCLRRNRVLVERLNKLNSNAKELNFPTKYSQSYYDQFLACLWKQNLSYWRNPQYTAVRFFYTLIISLMLGTICWRFGSKRSLFSTCLLCYHSFFWMFIFVTILD